MGQMPIVSIITLAYVLVLTGAATGVALFMDDPEHRDDAYRVLKLLLGATGGVGLLEVVFQYASYV